MSEEPVPSAHLAIVGMACRYPGSDSVEEFWRNLAAGMESITDFPRADLVGTEKPDLLDNPDYVASRGVLEGAEWFDAALFGYSPREATLIDPQHRLFLETAWQVLERAGCSPSSYPGAIGVYAGTSASTYMTLLRQNEPEVADSLEAGIGTGQDFLATRAAYKLGLRGPALTVQTACSTSLVAVHVAAQALLAGDCDVALAGGVSVRFPQRIGYLYRREGVLSPDGRCRTFDARAGGTVPSDGVGLVALKRLEDAVADGDHVHAVLRGTAINNDGTAKIGYTAPGVAGQSEVIRLAQAVAEVAPGTIGYVEAHGTATPLGDPIEVTALNQVFAGATSGPPIRLGSVKSNIGHTDAAAGVAGLIKAVLAVENGAIPPSPNFTRPNPELDLHATPFEVNTDLVEWRPSEPRRAGVSSFGIGGTNAHAVVEEAPPAAPRPEPTRAEHALVISARTPVALDTLAGDLAARLREEPPPPLGDVAHTLRAGRWPQKWRRHVVAGSVEEAAGALADPTTPAVRATDAPRLVFLFPGQGTHYPGMGRQLYETEPVFREELDHCLALLRRHTGTDLRGTLFASPGESGTGTPGLDRLSHGQPLLFSVEYALARWWIRRGARPDAMIGHSLGEYVAACLAGVFSLRDALMLVAERGRAIESIPEGGNVAVPLPETEVAPLLDGDLAIAAVNAPEQCVVSGSREATDRLVRQLDERGVDTRRLRISHAAHSPRMGPITSDFAGLVGGIRLSGPEIGYVSNLSGTWATAEDTCDPQYWANHLRHPVRFSEGMTTLLGSGPAVLLEIGPGGTLGALARANPAFEPGHSVLASMPGPRDTESDTRVLLDAAGRAWAAGVTAPLEHSGTGRERRVVLPTYPFERHPYFVGRPAGSATDGTRSARGRPDLDIAYTPPGTELEARIAGHFEYVLGISGVGTHDNFFELGGDSLVALRLLRRIADDTGGSLSVRELYSAGTSRALARLLDPTRDTHGSPQPSRGPETKFEQKGKDG